MPKTVIQHYWPVTDLNVKNNLMKIWDSNEARALSTEIIANLSVFHRTRGGQQRLEKPKKEEEQKNFP